MSKKYIYFVSYWGIKGGNVFSFRSAQIVWKNEIKIFDDLVGVTSLIKDDLNKGEYDGVTILNFQLLRVVKEENSVINAIKGVATELKEVVTTKDFTENIILSMIVGLVSFYIWEYVL